MSSFSNDQLFITSLLCLVDMKRKPARLNIEEPTPDVVSPNWIETNTYKELLCRCAKT